MYVKIEFTKLISNSFMYTYWTLTIGDRAVYVICDKFCSSMENAQSCVPLTFIFLQDEL